MANLRIKPGDTKSCVPFRMALSALLAVLFLSVETARAQYTTEPSASTPSSLPASVSPSTTAQEMVAEVRIIGNKSLPIEKITPFIRTRAGRPFDRDQVEEDVRRLDNSKMFVDVKTYYQRVPGGRIVIYEVFERPILLDIKFVGNSKVSRKKLQKEAALKAGDPLDPFAVEEDRRKLEDYYHKSG